MDEQDNLYDSVVPVSNESLIKINTYSIRRTLVFVAFIDFIFELINGFSYALDKNNDTLPLSYSSFICATIVLAGICGINRYHSCTSKIYGGYVGFKIIGYFALIFAYQINFFGLLFFGLIIMLNIWILVLKSYISRKLELNTFSNCTNLWRVFRESELPHVIHC